MKKLTILSIVALSLIAGSLGSNTPKAFAATPPPAPAPTPNPRNNGQALEIAPPVITLSGNPGETIKTQISLRDISSGNLLVKTQINDFVAASEDGTPKILLDNAEPNPFSIKGWVDVLPDQLMIPRQIKSLPVTIHIPANASPGGHYGVFRFTATPPDVEGSGVSLSASLGSLMLITVNGDTKEALSVKEFTVSKDGKAGKIFQSAPLTFTEKISNDGNIHEKPAGQIEVTDMFGKKIAGVNVNLPPRNILPASVRKFEQPLDQAVIGNRMLFGRYHAKLNLVYGAKKQVLSQTMTFWVIPYKLIAIIIAGLIIGILLIGFFIRRYNRRIIRKAHYSRNRKR